MKSSGGWNKILSLVLGLLLLGNCAGRKSVFLEKRPAPTPGANASELNAQAEGLWAKRNDAGVAYQALTAYRHAFAADPSNPDIGMALARAYAFVGEYLAPTEEERDTLFLRGLEAGERTLALNYDFLRSYQRDEQLELALSTLDKQWVPALYWTCANLAKWMANKKRSVRLGNKRHLEAYLKRLKALDDEFYFGGVYCLFGNVATKAPFSSKDNSKKSFEKAIEIAPNFFTNRRAYAIGYGLKHKERAVFQEQLEYIVNGDANALPEAFPENTHEQKKAKELLDEIDKYFKSEKAKKDYKPLY